MEEVSCFMPNLEVEMIRIEFGQLFAKGNYRTSIFLNVISSKPRHRS